MGPGASRVQVENPPGDRYWYKMVVCSREPLRLVRREPINDGQGMVVEAEVKGQAVRLLVVDGQSSPSIPRWPRLRDIASRLPTSPRTGRADRTWWWVDFNSVSPEPGLRPDRAGGVCSRLAVGPRVAWNVPLGPASL